MGEARQLSIVLLSTLFIGVLGLALAPRMPRMISGGDVVVEEYQATIYPNGTLVEDYLYRIEVSGRYRMLYRAWEVPLSVERLDRPYVEPVRVEPPIGAVGYVRDHNGRVWASAHAQDIATLAEFDEAGCYNPERFDAGEYRIRYVFKLHPPIRYDGEHCHLNLLLADGHLPYLKVVIRIVDGGLVKVAPYPASMRVLKREDGVEIHGSSGMDEVLGVELLLKAEALSLLEGFVEEAEGLEASMAWANRLYRAQYLLVEGLRLTSMLLTLLSPLILLGLYLRYGRERHFVIPRYLSYVPNPRRKPWVVNLVFKSDALDFDEDGFYATLLDLHRRRKIEIDVRGESLLIRVLDPNVDDEYERRALRLISKLSIGGVLNTSLFKELAESRDALLGLMDDIQYLTMSPGRRVALRLIISGKGRVVWLIPTSIILIAASFVAMLTLPYMHSLTLQALTYSALLLIQAIIAFSAPSTLFGRWRGFTYKEKLEWDSFRRFLSDMAMIKRYAPQDLSIWGDWLIYGTALGVGDKVVEAMRSLSIPLIDAAIAQTMTTAFRPIITASRPTRGGGGRGGGIGGGGGFGGGGGRVR